MEDHIFVLPFHYTQRCWVEAYVQSIKGQLQHYDQHLSYNPDHIQNRYDHEHVHILLWEGGIQNRFIITTCGIHHGFISWWQIWCLIIWVAIVWARCIAIIIIIAIEL